MGAVLNQLTQELMERQRQARYNLVKGAGFALWLALLASVVFLWKRPIALAYFVAFVLSAMIDLIWLFPLLLTVLLLGLIVFDLITTGGDRIIEIRRRLSLRRHRITLKRGWKNTVSDLGLVTSYDRRGSQVQVAPKLIDIEERS